MQIAGFIVIHGTGLFDRKTYKAFTKQAMDALRKEPFAVSTYKPIERHSDAIDYETAILARDERKTMDY